MIKFQSMDDRNVILYEGPYTIANRPVIVNAWEAGFNFEKEIMKVIPLWVQLPNLPLNCWRMNSLSRIGSILGTPLFADECTTNQNRISYARMLVEIDVTQPLKYQIQIEGEKGQVVEQKVLYDWVPPFCSKCQAADHNCLTRKTRMPPAPVPKKVWHPKVLVNEETVAMTAV